MDARMGGKELGNLLRVFAGKGRLILGRNIHSAPVVDGIQNHDAAAGEF